MEDPRIVQLYWDRDQKAITETATKYGNYCTFIAKNILGNNEDAEECVNDTYMKAWDAMPPHRPNMLSTFLGKITRNLSFNRYKHNSADKRGGGEISVVLDELSECISNGESTEQVAEKRELLRCINWFLDELPETERNMFVCRYWYLEPVQQIADRYGFSLSKTASMLRRTREKLRKQLIKEGLQ